jgi:hypothetical protein
MAQGVFADTAVDISIYYCSAATVVAMDGAVCHTAVAHVAGILLHVAHTLCTRMLHNCGICGVGRGTCAT